MAALGGSVARRYAKALFEVGVAQATFERMGEELARVADLYRGSAELREALENPVFKADAKRAILEQILPRVAPSPVVQRLVLLLAGRGRMALLPAIVRAYGALADARANQARAEVRSAQPLGTTDLERVRRALERRTGKKIIIETAVDPALIGGIVARVGDLVLDGSVRTRLDELRSRLIN